MKGFYTFLAGALVGAVATALLTPTSGPELRARIRACLQKRGILPSDDMDDLVEMIAAEIETQQPAKKK